MTVLANHFTVSQNDVELYHYDVAFSPETILTNRRRCREIMAAMLQQYQQSLGGRRPVYDGQKNIYTAGPLPFRQEEFRVVPADAQPRPEAAEGARPQRDRSVKVTITEVDTRPVLHALFEALAGNLADMPYNVLQALDCVVRESLMLRFVPVGRSFFSPEFGKSNVGVGVEAWKGFYQSLRPTQQGLSLVVDKSCTAFVQAMPVPQYVTQMLNRRDLSRELTDSERRTVKKGLIGLRVVVTHRGNMRMKFTVTGISDRPLRQITFPVDRDDGGEPEMVSIVDYFRNTYGMDLRLLNMPCLVKGRGDKPALFPMEVCNIDQGQHYKKKLNNQQVTEMLRIACTRPDQRKNEILQTVRANNYDQDPYTQEFGMQISPELTQVQARILDPPKLQYRGGGPFIPEAGAWNIRSKQLLETPPVNKWAVINFSRMDLGQVEAYFMNNFFGVCRASGLQFNPRPFVPFSGGNPANPDPVLWGVCKTAAGGQRPPEGVAPLDILFCILPDNNAILYGNIKRLCETEIGVVTQCMLSKNLLKGSPQYAANVALKVNVKVGGRNTALLDALNYRLPLVAQRDSPTIVFGADVTHGATDDTSPSIAAVVANMDWPHMTKFRCVLSAQKSNQEIIENLYVPPTTRDGKGGGIIKELLTAYYLATKMQPKRILFFRDGVSEGQFDAVRMYEIAAIKNACFSLSEQYDPPLTFVVVQKRHHTRLFPTEPRQGDRSGNTKPGTVVDTRICHPREFDFYLCSHAGIQGTSRPAHYHVLFDQNGFTSDSLQELTYSMCYTYARCTRSVSIVPPAYYAHLAAFRAKFYMGQDGSDSGSQASAPGQGQPGQPTGSGSRSSRSGQEAAVVRPLPNLPEAVKKVMFFC